MKELLSVTSRWLQIKTSWCIQHLFHLSQNEPKHRILSLGGGAAAMERRRFQHLWHDLAKHPAPLLRLVGM